MALWQQIEWPIYHDTYFVCTCQKRAIGQTRFCHVSFWRCIFLGITGIMDVAMYDSGMRVCGYVVLVSWIGSPSINTASPLPTLASGHAVWSWKWRWCFHISFFECLSHRYPGVRDVDRVRAQLFETVRHGGGHHGKGARRRSGQPLEHQAEGTIIAPLLFKCHLLQVIMANTLRYLVTCGRTSEYAQGLSASVQRTMILLVL